MNSRAFTASQTRRNAYHATDASLLKKVYREFASLSDIMKRERSAGHHDWKQHDNHHNQ